MKSNCLEFNRIIGSAITLSISCSHTLAQTPQSGLAGEDSGGWWFMIVLSGIVCIGAAFFVWRKFIAKPDPERSKHRNPNYYNTNDSYEVDAVDVNQGLQWLEKAKKAPGKPLPAIRTNGTSKVGGSKIKASVSQSNGTAEIDTRAFQEKMRRIQYSQLPINSFRSLRATRLYEPLPLSDDPSLLNAIEQANEEYEEDEGMREVALKVLAAFRTRNSVDALTQIALYDLSSNLRSKAVGSLTDFDHASVFEPILLACADPTREVRAAAARGLFRLTFDRTEAWKRILDTNDEFRMRHAARAAIEAGIVVKSFERLVHEDLKVAHEAFALTTFLISAGETNEIFQAIENHPDERVKFALLHVLKVQGDERAISRLETLGRVLDFSGELERRLNETLTTSQKVTV